MDRKEQIKKNEGSENGSENGSNEDSDNEEKVCTFFFSSKKHEKRKKEEICFLFILFYKWCMVFFIIHYCVQKWPFHRGIRRASGSPPRGTNDDSNVTAAPTVQVGGKILKINK